MQRSSNRDLERERETERERGRESVSNVLFLDLHDTAETYIYESHPSNIELIYQKLETAQHGIA